MNNTELIGFARQLLPNFSDKRISEGMGIIIDKLEDVLETNDRLKAELAAAHQEIAALKVDAEQVAWEYFSDRTYFDFCAVRPVGEKTWGNCFHVASKAEGKNLSHFLTKINAPNPWNAAMKGKDE